MRPRRAARRALDRYEIRQPANGSFTEFGPRPYRGAGLRSRSGRRKTVAAVAFAMLALGSCDAAPGDTRPDADEWRGTRLQTSLPRPDFTLDDTNGESFAFREQTEGTLTFLFFGYTHCPDICPIHMSSLGHVLEQFPHAVRSRVRVVFVSTDPARDSPQRIREWLDSMGRGFVGLRGTIDDINRIQIALGLPPATSSPGAIPGMDYPVGHAAQVLAFTPDDSAHFVYPFGTRQQDWMRDLPRLLNEFGTEP